MTNKAKQQRLEIRNSQIKKALLRQRWFRTWGWYKEAMLTGSSRVINKTTAN
ncbi:hypothetical protein [Spartinivicinus ruber]|uniref:hypothetical protein n=1 Tax=Spartinivicinus ruber TaxID=2683272 RepID=UPI0013D457F2|nr:hypothetical protein [Spartinivicinus ruber]